MRAITFVALLSGMVSAVPAQAQFLGSYKDAVYGTQPVPGALWRWDVCDTLAAADATHQTLLGLQVDWTEQAPRDDFRAIASELTATSTGGGSACGRAPSSLEAMAVIGRLASHWGGDWFRAVSETASEKRVHALAAFRSITIDDFVAGGACTVDDIRTGTPCKSRADILSGLTRVANAEGVEFWPTIYPREVPMVLAPSHVLGSDHASDFPAGSTARVVYQFYAHRLPPRVVLSFLHRSDLADTFVRTDRGLVWDVVVNGVAVTSGTPLRDPPFPAEFPATNYYMGEYERDIRPWLYADSGPRSPTLNTIEIVLRCARTGPSPCKTAGEGQAFLHVWDVSFRPGAIHPSASYAADPTLLADSTANFPALLAYGCGARPCIDGIVAAFDQNFWDAAHMPDHLYRRILRATRRALGSAHLVPATYGRIQIWNTHVTEDPVRLAHVVDVNVAETGSNLVFDYPLEVWGLPSGRGVFGPKHGTPTHAMTGGWPYWQGALQEWAEQWDTVVEMPPSTSVRLYFDDGDTGTIDWFQKTLGVGCSGPLGDIFQDGTGGSGADECPGGTFGSDLAGHEFCEFTLPAACSTTAPHAWRVAVAQDPIHGVGDAPFDWGFDLRYVTSDGEVSSTTFSLWTPSSRAKSSHIGVYEAVCGRYAAHTGVAVGTCY